MNSVARVILVAAASALAACSGGDDVDPDAGVSGPSACGVAGQAPAAECEGLDQCGAGEQNFTKDPTCDNCPRRADSHLCEAGACREVADSALVQVLLTVPAEAIGAAGFTIATLNPVMADGSRVTCDKLLSDACARGSDAALNFTSSTHNPFPGQTGASMDMVYQTGAFFEPGADRLLFVQATEELSGDGQVLAWACLEGLTVPLEAGQNRLGVDLVAK